MKFEAIDPQLIKEIAPSFYHKSTAFYAIKHQNKDAGLLSIKALSNKTAELGLLIFPPYRGKLLTPHKCKQILRFTELKGFVYIIIGTYLESMKKLCQAFHFSYLFTQQNKHWLKKELRA